MTIDETVKKDNPTTETAEVKKLPVQTSQSTTTTKPVDGLKYLENFAKQMREEKKSNPLY